MYTIRNLKITSQVLIFMIFVYIFIMAWVVSILMINIRVVSSLIEDSQKNIMRKQIDNQLRSLSNLASYQVQRFIERAENRLYVTNKLFELNNKSIIQLNDPVKCLNYFVDQYAPLSTYCYGIFGDMADTNMTSDKLLENLASLLTYSYPILDNEFDLLFTSLTENEIFSIWPGSIMDGYIPSSRQWYQNHLKSINGSNVQMYETYYSQPYMHYNLHTPTTSSSMSIYNPDNSIFGIASCQLNLSLILPQQFFKKLNAQGFIFDLEGYILFGDQQIQGTLTRLNDTSIFSSTDQAKIIYQAQGIEQQHNCSILNKTESLCLRDKTSGQELIISSSVLKQQEFMLAIVINPSQEINSINEEIQYFNERITLLLVKIAQDACFLLMGSFIIALFMLILIQSSINYITTQTKINIYKSRRQRRFNMEKLQKLHYSTNNIKNNNKCSLFNSTIFKLNKAYRRLSKSIAHTMSRKNETCKQIEKINYPKICLLHDSTQIQKELYSIPNQCDQVTALQKILLLQKSKTVFFQTQRFI